MTKEEAQIILKNMKLIAALAKGDTFEESDHTGNWEEVKKPDLIHINALNLYRIKPEPVYIPFVNEDYEQFMCKTVIDTDNTKGPNIKLVIVGCNNFGIYLPDRQNVCNYATALKTLIFINNKPFGKLAKESDTISLIKEEGITIAEATAIINSGPEADWKKIIDTRDLYTNFLNAAVKAYLKLNKCTYEIAMMNVKGYCKANKIL